jgi:hypothetical protein
MAAVSLVARNYRLVVSLVFVFISQSAGSRCLCSCIAFAAAHRLVSHTQFDTAADDDEIIC